MTGDHPDVSFFLFTQILFQFCQTNPFTTQGNNCTRVGKGCLIFFLGFPGNLEFGCDMPCTGGEHGDPLHGHTQNADQPPVGGRFPDTLAMNSSYPQLR
jgi:hypothetical protein